MGGTPAAYYIPHSYRSYIYNLTSFNINGPLTATRKIELLNSIWKHPHANYEIRQDNHFMTYGVNEVFIIRLFVTLKELSSTLKQKGGLKLA